MNRLQNAQKLLAESLAALESAVDQARSSAALAATVNESGTAPPIDISQLSQDLSAIETDLETAMKMIADLTASGLSSGAGKDRI